MKKIFGYIGSMKGGNSNTSILAKNIVRELSLICNEEIESEFIYANEVDIKYCLGCSSCFKNGKCVLDNKDDMKMIKNKILEADLFIIGSPVYFHNISGQTKVLFDRLSYWSHIFKLVGKPVVTISTSSSNGNRIVNSYLNKAMCSLGASVIGSFGCTCEFPPLLEDNDYVECEIPKFSNIVYDSLNGKSSLKATQFHEELFENLKFQFLTHPKERVFEHIYWKDNGYFNCSSFQELINLKSKI